MIDEIDRVAADIRRRVLDHTVRNNGGYLSQACSSSEIFASLYLGVLRVGPTGGPLLPDPFAGTPGACTDSYKTGAFFNGPRSAGFDRFILSPSQYSLVLYAALIALGRMRADALDLFNRDGSTVEMIGAEHSPGMELMTGSLGQGLSQAAGIALGRRHKAEKGRVVVFMSDGEFQSGQTWECLQTMAHHRISNVIVYVDVNGYQCDGKMSSVMSVEPLADRLRSFGAIVRDVDGHDIEALVDAGNHGSKTRPLVVLCHTDPCRGVPPLKANKPKLHYLRFKNEGERKRYADFLGKMG